VAGGISTSTGFGFQEQTYEREFGVQTHSGRTPEGRLPQPKTQGGANPQASNLKDFQGNCSKGMKILPAVGMEFDIS